MTVLEPGNVAGTIRLPDRSGRIVSTWRYRQRQPLVLLLWDRASPALLDEFARHYPDYRDAGAEVVAIATAQPPARGYPFPLLHDADGGASAALAGQRPAILVLDAYGELFRRWEGDAARRPDHRDILEWLAFTAIQCEECGPHAENWPRRDPGL
jgi:peroxiredoxin